MWQWVWFVLCSCGIIIGRAYDNLSNATVALGNYEVRLGMAIVSTCGVLASIPVIRVLVHKLIEIIQEKEYMNTESLVGLVLRQSATRLIFVNLIDVGLICEFLLPAAVGMPYVRWFFDNWDNSRLAYFACDILLTNMLALKASSKNSISVKRQDENNSPSSLKVSSRLEIS
ncbi:hypothetical protein HK100_009123 [Physocladia obscura]|uniref:Uncharacterized protein n=1 Tax=Physocladia obscura TaxID=109957 RepID=A0AAD5T4P2_9FUNG|nr:hypothetical protein HK100_009123 [Physocladia obscura]